MDERMNFNSTFFLARRHWKLLLVVGLAACVLSALFSGPRFLKPRYRSQAVVYPINISTYSIESTTDQLVQLMQSNSIRDSVVQKFNLVQHYGIDTAKAEGRAILHYLWGERVGIEKTRFESVDLQVTDEDPVLARNMAVEILHQTNLLARSIQRHQSEELLQVIRLDLVGIRHKMDSVEMRLNQLRQTNGLLDYEQQAGELTRGYMRALTSNTGKAQKDEISSRLKGLEDHGGEFLRLSTLNTLLTEDLGKKLAQERQVELDLTKALTYSSTVVHPEVPDKKIYPVRWLVVLLSTCSALLLCYILLSLREPRRPAALAERG